MNQAYKVSRQDGGRSVENLIALALSLIGSVGFAGYCLLYFAGLFSTTS